MLALLKHPNIIEAYGKVKEYGQDVPSLLLELADSDLLDFQNERWRLLILSQLRSGMWGL